MQSLTLDDQDVERLLNCLDGQARLPTAMPGFPWPTRSLRTSSSAHNPDARRTRCCERHPGVQDWPPERGACTPETPPSTRPVAECSCDACGTTRATAYSGQKWASRMSYRAFRETRMATGIERSRRPNSPSWRPQRRGRLRPSITTSRCASERASCRGRRFVGAGYDSGLERVGESMQTTRAGCRPGPRRRARSLPA